MKKVTVLLNRTEDAEGRLAIFSRFGDESGFQPGDTLEEVISFKMPVELGPDTDDATGMLEKVWAMFNRGSGSFVGDGIYPQRSLSTGDVVEIDGRRYTAKSVGWEELRPEPWHGVPYPKWDGKPGTTRDLLREVTARSDWSA